jgi:phosphoglycerol transferase MdoB-like AlkP superfamily enzyme
MSGGASDTPIPFGWLFVFLILFGLLNLAVYTLLWKNKTSEALAFTPKLFAIKTISTILFIIFGIFAIRGFDTKPLKANDYIFNKRHHANIISRNFFFNFASEVALYIKLNRDSKYVGILPPEETKRIRKFMEFHPNPISKNPLEHKLERCFRDRYKKSERLSKTPNLVIFQIESLGFNPFEKMPFLQKLAKKSIFYDHFNATGTITFDGIWSTLCGVSPTFGRLQTALLSNNFQCITDVLKKKDYTNSFFYAGDLKMDDLVTFANKHHFDNVFGRNSFPRSDQKLSRFLDDDTFFTKAFEHMKGLKQPFFTYILNVQTHPPSEIPKDFVWPKNVKEKSIFSYFDLSIEKFFKRVQNEDFYKDTIFLITGDHTPHNQSHNPTDDRSIGTTLWEFRIPLIIHVPALAQKNEKPLHEFSSQNDIPASVFDMLNVNENIKGWGTSLFCKTDNRHPVVMFSRRLSYMSILKNDKIYSSFYKGFTNNKLLAFSKQSAYDQPVFDVSKNGDEKNVREMIEFLYHVNRNIISNNYYWE